MIDALCIRIDAFAHVADKVGVVLGMLAIALALVPVPAMPGARSGAAAGRMPDPCGQAPSPCPSGQG
jgi:hypothetical protein